MVACDVVGLAVCGTPLQPKLAGPFRASLLTPGTLRLAEGYVQVCSHRRRDWLVLESSSGAHVDMSGFMHQISGA